MRLLQPKRKEYLDKWSRLRPRSRKKRQRRTPIEKPSTVEGPDDELVAPAVFNIAEVGLRRDLLNFISRFRRRLLRAEAQNLTLNFSGTEQLFPGGMLLFVSELRRMIRHSQGKHVITCVQPKNDKVRQVFEQLEVNALLGVSGTIQPVDDDVVNWRFAHGHKVDGDRYEDVLAEYDGEIAEAVQQALYTGMTEAMTNVVNHAYELPRDDGCAVEHEKQWWMFSHLRDNKLAVVFCDLGAGIPRTLPLKRQDLWAKLVRHGRANDASAIENAVKDSISRTKLQHRGKGLGQIFSAVMAAPGASVNVFSNFGLFSRAGSGKVTRHNYSDSIMGTLIHWSIPLPPKEES